MSRPMHDAVAEQDFAIHEHREVLPWLDRIHDVGCAVGHLSVGELKVELHRVVVWLEHCLEDHAAWEEAWLYPAIDAHAGTPFATKTVRFEHQQIRNGVRHLSADQATLGHELTRTQADELHRGSSGSKPSCGRTSSARNACCCRSSTRTANPSRSPSPGNLWAAARRAAS